MIRTSISCSFTARAVAVSASPGSSAAVIRERVGQGAGGMHFYSPAFLREVRTLCDEHDVLLIADGDSVQVGRPTIGGATVKATVVQQYRGKKILVWKYQAKLRYRRRRGHRQDYTRLRIDTIVTG